MILRLLACAGLVAPLIVIPGQLDFSSLPQQVCLQAFVVVALGWLLACGPLPTAGRRPLDLPLAAFLACAALSLASTPERAAGWQTLGHWLACFAAYVIVSRAARPGDATRLAAAVFAGGAVVAVIGLAQALGGLTAIPQAVAPAGTLANRNVAAGYLVAVAPLGLLAWRIRARGWRPLIACGAILLAAYLPFTLSRTTALAAALQLAVLGCLAAEGRIAGQPRRRGLVLACGTASLVILGVAIASSWHNPAKVQSTAIRLRLAAAAWSMALERPLLGVGLGRFVAHFPSHGGELPAPQGGAFRVDSPHNEALQVFAEGGLLALAALSWLALAALRRLLWLLRATSRAARARAWSLGLCLLGLGVDAMLGFPLRLGAPAFLWAIVLGLLAMPAAGESDRSRRLSQSRTLGHVAFAGAAMLVVSVALLGSLLHLAGDRALGRLRRAEAAGRWTEAAAEGRWALSVDPRPAALIALARNELRLGRPAAAAALLRSVLAVWPQDPVALPVVARLGAPARDDGREIQDPTRATAADSCAPGISVELLAADRVTLKARLQPVTAVLRCLGERTGLKVEYDGPPPRQTVSLALSDVPLASAVEGLFEGLGIDFALSADASGRRLGQLIVFAGGSRSSGSSASPPAPAAPAAPVYDEPEPPPVAEEAPPPEPQSAAPPSPMPELMFPGGPPIMPPGPRPPGGGEGGIEIPEAPMLTPIGG